MITAFKSATLRRLLFPLAAFALTAGYGTTASAVAMFSFDSSLTAEITAPTGVDVFVDVFDDGAFLTDTFGTGSVDSTFVAVLDGTAAASLAHSATGSTDLPDGFVEIESNPIIDFTFENTTSADAEVLVTVVWDLDTSASADDPFLEFAFADSFAFVEVDDATGITTYVDEASSSDSLFGPTPNVGSLDFTIFVAAGDVAFLTLDLLSHGVADSLLLLPEPGTIALLALGLLGAAGAKRRRAA